MKDNASKGWNENLKWLVFGACSQLDSEVVFNGTNTISKWVDVLVNNEKMNGILGYSKTGPGANSSGTTDEKVMKKFTSGIEQGKSIKEAWEDANAYYLGIKSKYWGVLVKDTCENYTLSDSLDQHNISYNSIYLYRYEYDKVIFDSSRNALEIEESVDNINYSRDYAVNTVQQYLNKENIPIDNLDITMEISVRDIFDNQGGYKETQNLGYIFEITPKGICLHKIEVHYKHLMQK